MDLYLLDADGQQVGGVAGEQGYLAPALGKEVVDFRVDQVADQTIVSDASGDRMVGDDYYVLAVAFNETAKVRVSGYYPQIDLDAGSDVGATGNYHLASFGFPAKASATFTLRGPTYSSPYKFRPTSEGVGSCRLEWPANVSDPAKLGVVYDPVGAPEPAKMAQYLYAGASFTPVFENDGSWAPPAQGDWWGLFDEFEVRDDVVAGPGLTEPQQDMLYVPSLCAVASDPMHGASLPPMTGVRTLGYKATVSYPENLRISGVKRSGDYRVVRGTFALNGTYVSGARVTLQRKATAGWVNLKSTVTSSTGVWSIRLVVNKAIKVRVRAAGDPATGLDVEYSLVRTVRPCAQAPRRRLPFAP